RAAAREAAPPTGAWPCAYRRPSTHVHHVAPVVHPPHDKAQGRDALAELGDADPEGIRRWLADHGCGCLHRRVVDDLPEVLRQHVGHRLLDAGQTHPLPAERESPVPFTSGGWAWRAARAATVEMRTRMSAPSAGSRIQ